MTIIGTTTSSKEALDHLRSIKPNDGWSVEIQHNENDDDGLRLLRRNAPLTDHFFLDIHHNGQSNAVVGVLTKDGETCQILVAGETGMPVPQKKASGKGGGGGVGYVSCASTYPGYERIDPAERRTLSRTLSESTGICANEEGRGSFLDALPSRAMMESSRSERSLRREKSHSPNPTNRRARTPAEPMAPLLSEAEKQLYMRYAKMGIGSWIAFKVLSQIMGEGSVLFFLVLPGVYAYGLQSCPDNATFDAKKEVKRVLRGHHLPENHPSKPRKGNFLEEWTAKISASVATEVGAAAGGYSIEIAPLLGGVVKHTTVTLPTLNLTCEWIGCNNSWYHFRTYTPESAP